MYHAPRLHSIQEIQPEDVYSTGEVPVRVRASDRALYVTKPCRAPGDHAVVREFLAAHFLKIWGLDVPDFAVIEVREQHLPDFLHQRLQQYHFQLPAFGSKLRDNTINVDQLMARPPQQQVEISGDNNGLLEIALFDLWLKNDDRNENNSNLLYTLSTPHKFVPIDHGALFDFGMPGAKLTLQTETDSILTSRMAGAFLGRQQRAQYLDDPGAKSLFFGRVAAVEIELAFIIEALPVEWTSGLAPLEGNLRATIFTQEWLDLVWDTFCNYLRPTL